MKAMILNEYGNNAQFQLTELSQPSAIAGHVVVRVAATSVNTVDTMIRQRYQPYWEWTLPAPLNQLVKV